MTETISAQQDKKPPLKKDNSFSMMAITPSVSAAATIQTYQSNLIGSRVEMFEVFEELENAATEIKNGNLHKLEKMLLCQATALDTMFASLAHRAHAQERVSYIETFLSLALKAQAQSRATISALVDLKYPRQVAFVKQTNVSNGAQQVNNGVAHAREGNHVSTNKLSGETHELLQDTRASSTTIESNPRVATVEKVHRAKVRRG